MFVSESSAREILCRKKYQNSYRIYVAVINRKKCNFEEEKEFRSPHYSNSAILKYMLNTFFPVVE